MRSWQVCPPSALAAFNPSKDIPGILFVTGSVKTMNMVKTKGLNQWEIAVTSSGIEPATSCNTDCQPTASLNTPTTYNSPCIVRIICTNLTWNVFWSFEFLTKQSKNHVVSMMTKPCGARPRNCIWFPERRRELFCLRSVQTDAVIQPTCYSGVQVALWWGKDVEVWSSPLTYTQCFSQELLVLYLHYSIFLNDVRSNYVCYRIKTSQFVSLPGRI